MFQARSAAWSANSCAVLFPPKSAQLSMRLFVVEAVEDLDLLGEEDLEGVVLGHQEVVVDLVLLEVMVALDPLEVVEVDFLQEVVEVMELTDGKDGLQTHQVEGHEDMEEDPVKAVGAIVVGVDIVDLVEDLVEVEEAL